MKLSIIDDEYYNVALTGKEPTKRGWGQRLLIDFPDSAAIPRVGDIISWPPKNTG